MTYPTTIPFFLVAVARQITLCKRSNAAEKGKIG